MVRVATRFAEGRRVFFGIGMQISRVGGRVSVLALVGAGLRALWCALHLRHEICFPLAHLLALTLVISPKATSLFFHALLICRPLITGESSVHIVLICACEKRALLRTARVLDAYALRQGSRIWLTPITAEGLEVVHRELRRVATRQTAVACYRNDGRIRMQLLWIVMRLVRRPRRDRRTGGALPCRAAAHTR